MSRSNRASHRDALMLVDFQRDFLADDGRMPVARSHVADLVTTTCAAITRARDEGELIVKVGNEFKHHHFIGNALRHNAALAGSPGADWDLRIDAPMPSTYRNGKRTRFATRSYNRCSLTIRSRGSP